MLNLQEIKKSLLAAIWFMFLTFPIMVIRVNTIEKTIQWRWERMIMVGLATFLLSFLWRYLLRRKEMGQAQAEIGATGRSLSVRVRELLKNPVVSRSALALVALLAVCFPFISSLYQINIMTTALIYVMVGLGLNIVVGLAGLLDLGYVAFYAVGAYSYALLNYHFGLGFWTLLPVGALLAMLFGIILGFPVLRLRGDYLAIVTLGFGEIIHLVLKNWNALSFGPSGIDQIPRPELLGIDLTPQQTHAYIYYLMLGLTLFTIIVVRRLENSRVGRAWVALREDEVACQAMGIDKTRTKLSAFAMGATWAGMGGVVFAAKTTFINPSSFTIWESIIILCVVVLGGMGSIVGVACGAFILILLPEYLRAFSQYRLLIFGAVLVLMMVFRPGGLISNVRKTYQFKRTSS